MNVSEQGASRDRHHVIPRTLIFVTSRHPETGARDLLLLKGAPNKRLWANRYNGIGGHVEAHEDLLTAAQRELAEEAGLHNVVLELRGIVHIDAGRDAAGVARPGILIAVFHGESHARNVRPTAEGAPEWIPLEEVAALPLVDDLPALLPRTLVPGPLFYGHYAPQPDGSLHLRFRP